MKRKLSLRGQLLIILLVFIVLILTIVYLFQTNFLDDFYRKSKENSIIQVAENVEKYLKQNDVFDYYETIGFSNEVCVRVASNDYHYENKGACILRSLDDRTINNIYKEVNDNSGSKMFYNFVSYNEFDARENVKDMLIFGKNIKINESDILILVSSIITPLNATISTIKSQYVIIACVVIFATILLALIISHFIIKPINKINSESKNLSKGEYNSNNIKPFNSEYAELNETLMKANDDILKADKAKKELLANVTHDLRTPLTMIVGYGEMIRDLPEENNVENINVIIDEAKRLSTLVDDLIDISRLESSKIELSYETISIYDLLFDVYKQYEIYCKSQNVSFKLDAKKKYQKIMIDIDIHRIKQVIYNFINNSLNYNNKAKQKIVLGVEEIKDYYRIYVYDNGPGIKQEDINNIWERYYKVDKTHKRNHIGSGIGLSLSKDLLIAHNLKYGVESIENEYSKFFFEIKARE